MRMDAIPGPSQQAVKNSRFFGYLRIFAESYQLGIVLFCDVWCQNLKFACSTGWAIEGQPV